MRASNPEGSAPAGGASQSPCEGTKAPRRARPSLSMRPKAAFLSFPRGSAPSPHSLFGGAAATALLGRADECRRPTQGACVSGDRSLFNQKGPPLRRAQWGGTAATALLGRAASAALTQGARVWGDRSLFNQKGPPLRCAQWGNKENGPLERSKRERARGTIAAFLRKCSAAPHRGPRAICQRGQCRARRRELQEWSDQRPSHWGPRRAQRGGEWNHVPP